MNDGSAWTAPADHASQYSGEAEETALNADLLSIRWQRAVIYLWKVITTLDHVQIKVLEIGLGVKYVTLSNRPHPARVGHEEATA